MSDGEGQKAQPLIHGGGNSESSWVRDSALSSAHSCLFTVLGWKVAPILISLGPSPIVLDLASCFSISFYHKVLVSTWRLLLFIISSFFEFVPLILLFSCNFFYLKILVHSVGKMKKGLIMHLQF